MELRTPYFSNYTLFIVENGTAGWHEFHNMQRTSLFGLSEAEYDASFHDSYMPVPALRTSYLLKFRGQPVASARLDDLGGGRGAFRSVAVAVQDQGKGHGRALVTLIADAARTKGITELCVNASASKTAFYRAVGFCVHDWNQAELAAVRPRKSARMPVQMSLQIG